MPFQPPPAADRKLLGKSDKLKPLKPGLHSQKAHRGFALPAPLAAVVGPVLALRKRLLYAVATVHYSDGQSRWLQVRWLGRALGNGATGVCQHAPCALSKSPVQ